MKYQQWKRPAGDGAGRAALEEAGIPALPALVLSARGVDTPKKARAFLAGGPERLADPLLLRDMDRAVERIRRAVERGERVAVYGDYDVDGITSTCLLTRFLRSRGADVVPYIPDRMEEGYGLSCAAVDALRAQAVTLIITVDCGITAVEEARHAAELGVDLVITDHHECKEELPSALAVVDPRRGDCPYPFKSLAGVGVALKLVLALGEPEERPALLREYADLAAIGTVADVMLLTGENRSIVQLGLSSLRHTRRPGLAALLREAGLSEKPLTSMAIGYTLAPRINAAGRMGCARVAAELLLTADPVRGEELAKELCSLNRERQSIEADIFAQCAQIAGSAPPEERSALVLAGEGWHQGVVGIVASRLAERYSCPTFMICLQDGHGRGSCRSFGGFNLFAALEACAGLLEGFGGHEMAAGFTIREEQIPAFRRRMNELVRLRTGGEEMVSELDIDAEIPDPAMLTREQVEALDILEPYGAGNEKPVFFLGGCTVSSLNEVGGGRHLKLRLLAGGRPFDAIFFAVTAAEAGVRPGDRVDIAFCPQINEYRGWRSVQLQITDLRPGLTRAQSEQALYDRFARGEVLSPREAAFLLPSREEFVTLWRYLKGRSGGAELEETPRRLTRNLSRDFGRHAPLPRTLVCLEVFDERGLISLEQHAGCLRISLQKVEGKVDLEQSAILQRLRQLMSG
ncbi:MAG: single-stranded-DNA-specific exonuclease RecJ [Clostridiales bacterium]|nr:single-stranded-DNA-specific exonuclease RecJ [Clostridiales bacterium]